jgi:actin related protein 2/3 complex subunit 1A/1B
VDGPAALPALGASKFGDCLLELPLPGGWGLAVAFSLDGATLAAASQASQLTLLPGLDLQDPASLGPAAAAGRAQHLQLPALPLKCLAFLSDTLLGGGGFDCHPLLFQRQADGRWQHAASLRGVKAGSSSKTGASATSLMARVKLFEQHAAAVSAAGGGRAAAVDKENSVPGSSDEEQGRRGPHRNTIISIVPLAGTSTGRLSMLTASLEGCLAEWHVNPAAL